MKRIASFLFVATLAAFAALPATAMTWSVNPSNANQIIDDTGSWTLTLSYFNQTYDGVQYIGREISASSYVESGADGILDLTTVETDTGYKIVSIGNNRWENSTTLKEVYLPDTIALIGRQVFRNDTNLKKVKLPTAFCRWHGDGGHFSGCSSLTTIYYTGVEPEEGVAKIPPSVKVLPYYFLGNCTSIRRVEAPGVEITYNRALPGMTALESASFSPNLRAVLNNNTWNQTLFHNDQNYLANLVDFSPSVLGADFQMIPANLAVTNGLTINATYSDTGAGMFANTAITNYFDMSACTFDTIPSLAFYRTAIAGATIPASVTAIKDQAFKQLRKTATIRFLGAPPTFDNQGQNNDNVPFRNNNASNNGYTYNTVGLRHVFVVDAETYPDWTNQYFVSVADIKTSNDNNVKNYQAAVNDPTDSSQDFPTPDYPEETLGITNYGHRPNEYAWIVQYVDHSNVAATWINGDAQFDSTTVATGTAPTAPDGTPTKDSTAEFDYTFIGWNTDPDATTALDLSQLSLTVNTTFYAIFSAATRSYTITWKLDANTDIDTTTVLYGATPVHADASKPATAEYSYEFLGWSTDGSTVLASIPAVTGDATYIAVFQQHDAATTATISWFDEDGSTPLDPATTTVTKGVQPTHTEPAKASTIDTDFTFDGWVEIGGDGIVIATAALPAASGDVSYKAHFASSVRQYTVTFANWDGTVISATAYDYGTAAGSIAVPSDPTRAADAEYTYAFAGWNSEVAQVTGDATYTATYTATANEYNATFVDGIDESVISGPTTYAFGAAVTAPAVPEHYGYTFAAWSPEVGTMPAADTTYTATYTPNKYTITWVNGDSTTTAQYDYHTAVSAITVPTGAKADTSKASYTFVEWSPAIEPVESNTTYTATFTMNIASPMTIALDSAAYDRSQGEATVVTVVGNTDAAATTTAEATAQFRTASVTGEATVDGTTVTSVFDNFASGRGYEWTITATQTYGAEYSGASESASIKGRTYARAAKSWFGDGDVNWNEGAFAPAAQSGSGAQVRLRATVTFPAILPRVLPDAGAAVVGITAYQPNAGVAPRYYAWNGSQWVKLVGVAPKGGVAVNLLGVVDFARKNGPAVAWYADGFQLTTEDGNWEVPLAGGTQLSSFGLVGDLSVGSLSGDYDIGGVGFRVLVR